MNQAVSIITPYRNADKFIPRFVSSLQAQTRTDWVCIMVDDGSTDDGPQTLRRIVRKDPRFLLLTNTLSKSRHGPASARNCALAAVRSPLVAFCDVDDIWHPEKLERQLSFHTSNSLDLSVTAYGRFFDDQPGHPLRSYVCPPAKLDLGKLPGRNPIPMLTAIMSTELARIGFKQIPHEDFLFWLDLLRVKPLIRYGCLPLILAFYCIHTTNISRSKARMPMWAYSVFRNAGYSITASLLSLAKWALDNLTLQLNILNRSRLSSHTVPELLTREPIKT